MIARTIVAVCLLSQVPVAASELDETLKSSLLRMPTNQRANKLSVEGKSERELYWSETEVNSNGYFSVQVPRPYLDTISLLASKIEPGGDLAARATQKRSTLDSSASFFGELVEPGSRKTLFFRFKDRPGMITVWDFIADGARITQFNDFLNASINGNRGTLSLAKNSQEPNRAIWKISWIQQSVLYEIYLEDELKGNGEPVLAATELPTLAADMITNKGALKSN